MYPHYFTAINDRKKAKITCQSNSHVGNTLFYKKIHGISNTTDIIYLPIFTNSRFLNDIFIFFYKNLDLFGQNVFY